MPARRRTWLWILLGTALAVVVGLGALGLTVLRWYSRGADAGEKSPDAAGNAWVLTFNPTARDDTVGLSRLVAESRRDDVMRQRKDYLAQIEADYAKHHWNPGKFTTNGGAQDTETRHGDQADVITWIVYESHDPTSPTVYNGPALPWRFELRRDNNGWHVWSFTPPAWCGGYSTCDEPRASSPATPSPSATLSSPQGPLGPLASASPCGPMDPLRELRSCPPSTSPAQD